MGYVYRILNRPAPTVPHRTRQKWLHPGEPVAIGERCTITLRHTRFITLTGCTYTSEVEMQGGDSVVHLPVEREAWYRAEAWAGLHIYPLALELDGLRKPNRMLVQFIRVNDNVRWAS